MKNNWKTKKYKDVVTKVSLTNKKVKKGDYLEEGEIPVVDQGQELIGGYIDDYSKVIQNNDGTVIFGDHTKNVKFLNRDFAPGADGIKVLVPKGDLLPKALYYFTKAIQLPNKGYARHYQYLEKADIHVPPKDEQKSIVQKLDSLFSKIDAGEAGLEKVEKQLEAYRQSNLKKLFSKKDTAKLGDLIEDIRYGTSKKSDYGLGDIPVIRIPNVNVEERTLDDADLKTSDLSDKEYKKLKLHKGDVLVIRSNGSIDLVGRTAVVSEKYEGYAFAGYLIRLSINKLKVLPEYLSLAMSAPFVRNQIQLKGKSTSGVNNINSQELQDLNIPFASLELQVEIVEKMNKLESIIKQVRNAIEFAKKDSSNLRQSILKKAFNGELI
jgi:type I restriction enzyme S subunit